MSVLLVTAPLCSARVLFLLSVQVFGMTASPTVECVEVLQSKAYVCEDDLIEEFEANAEWELLFYKVRCSTALTV